MISYRVMGSPDGNNTCPAKVAAVAAQYGLEALGVPSLVEAHAIAVRLIGEGVAPAERLIALQAHFSASVFGLRESGQLTGLLAAFPLNALGLAAVENQSFDAAALDIELVSSPGERPAAYYGWGFAATTKDGARAVMRASSDIHRLLYWGAPTFARAVTNDGVRALQSIGFRPHAVSAGLFHIPPSMDLVRA